MEVERKKASGDLDVLLLLQTLIKSGNVEVALDIKRNIENSELGDDALMKIGEDYEKIDDIGQSVANKIEEVKKKYDSLKDKSKVSMDEMLKDAGLTAEGIDKDFAQTRKNVSDDITSLSEKLKNAKTESEKKKLSLEIARKKEQLLYLDRVRKGLKDLTKDPFNIKVKLSAIIPESIKKLFKQYFGLDLDDKDKDTVSEKAKQEGKAAKERKEKPREEKKSSKDYIEDRKKANRQKKADYQKYLAGKGTITVQGTQYDLSDLKPEEAEKLENYFKGMDSGKGDNVRKKKMADKARRRADELKDEERMADLTLQKERALEDAEIQSINNNYLREQKQRDIQHKRTLEDLKGKRDEIFKEIYQRRKAEYENKHSEQGLKYENTAEGYAGWLDPKAQENMLKTFTKKERELFDTQLATNDAKSEEEKNKNLQRIREIAKKRDQSLNAYYEKYGSDEEKRAATIKRNEDEINAAREEGDMGKLFTAQAKMVEDLKQFDAETIKQNLNWDAIFSDISNYDLQFLTSLEGQLEEAMKQGIEKGISAADMKVLGDKFQQVKDLIADRSTGIFSTGRLLGGSWMGNVAQQRSAQQRREERAADAEKNLSQARKKEQKANDKRDLAELNLREMMSKHPMDSKEVKEAEEGLAKAKKDANDAKKETKSAEGEEVF